MTEETESTQYIFNILPPECIPIPGRTWITKDITESPMPSDEKAVLLFLLCKEPTYRVNTEDMKKIGMSAYKIKKALKYLQNTGYARCERKNRQTNWYIYSKPQHSADNIDAPPID